MQAGPRSRGSTVRDYPPLMLAALVLLGLLAVMPSALNLPQSNPSETLEYAPVPPDDDDVPPPPTGNLSALGLGSSASVGAEAELGDGEGPDFGPSGESGVGKSPSTKRCVGNPPRQAEDPLSPPCVAHYEGDNGGSTYQGVSGQEVRILVYMDSRTTSVTSRGQESRPSDTYFDLWDPPEDSENVHVRGLRLLQRYFDERYQLYGRKAHFFIYFSPSASSNVSPEQRRAEAAENFQRIKPFAVIADTSFGAQEAYLDVMVRRGVLNFSSVLNRTADFYRRYKGLAWGYLPTLEVTSRFYSSYICDKVVGRPVSFGGNNSDPDSRLHNGSPRRLGLFRTTDERAPGLVPFADLVKSQIEACGGTFVAEATFPTAGYAAKAGESPAYADEAVAAFRHAGVTTVIWPGGWELNMTKAAARQNYRPEWVVAGDYTHEGRLNSRSQEQSVWEHAWIVSGVLLVDRPANTPCYQAVREVDPSFPAQDVPYACALYNDLRQLFTGIQVAGPNLNPRTVEKGYRAIPAVESASPSVPACYYEPGDYTCVKDAVAMWWDPDGVPEGEGDPGCWRMIYDGKRFLIGGWPDGDVAADQKPDDVCNNVGGAFYVQI